MGAQTSDGLLTKKPWRLATTSDDMVEKFSDLLCTAEWRRDLDPKERWLHDNHEQLEGGTRTRDSAFYPLKMAQMAHAVFRSHFNREINVEVPQGHSGLYEAAAPAVETLTLSAFDVDKWWIVDTGCRRDLMQKSKAMMFSRHIEAALNVTLDTGAGKVDSDEALSCAMNLGDFVAKVRAYLLKTTPSVISVGARVCVYGYAFVWFPGFVPGIVTPMGLVIALHEYNGIPYISARTVLEAMRNPDRSQRKVGVSVHNSELSLCARIFVGDSAITDHVDYGEAAMPGPEASTTSSSTRERTSGAGHEAHSGDGPIATVQEGGSSSSSGGHQSAVEKVSTGGRLSAKKASKGANREAEETDEKPTSAGETGPDDNAGDTETEWERDENETVPVRRVLRDEAN